MRRTTALLLCLFAAPACSDVVTQTVAPDAAVDAARDGSTMCPAPQIDCGGVCVDPTNDPLHCGGCNFACAVERECSAAACTARCETGTVRCGAECVSLASNDDHCGACGRACADGTRCANGACEVVCPSGQALCEGACIDVTADDSNCGACGVGCFAGQTCTDAVCTLACGAGRTNCGDRCVDTQTSDANCGACERACATGTRCVAGVCRGDPCGPDDSATGRCLDNTIARCVGGEVMREACPFGQVCAVVDGAPRCAAPTGSARVTGTVRYETRTPDGTGPGTLAPAPAQGLALSVVDDAGRVLVQGITGRDGRYELPYEPPASGEVRVRATLARTDGIYNFTVRDFAGATYAFSTVAFTPGDTAARDITVSVAQNAGAITVFDLTRRAFDFLATVINNARPAALYVTWQRNRATRTGGAYYSGASSTMFLNGDTQNPDEYDFTVIAHEFGHYMQRWYSRANNPGGPHDGTPADPNLAYGEGNATFLASLITGSSAYLDYGTTRPRVAMDLLFVPQIRPYMASASGGLAQPISEWLVAAAQYAMFRAGSDPAEQLRRAMRVFTGHLRRTPLPDRGEPGVDMVDSLDGYLCENAGADRMAIQNFLVTQRRFPYDFAYAPVCR